MPVKTLMYPKEQRIDSSKNIPKQARVLFRSYQWSINTHPKLENSLSSYEGYTKSAPTSEIKMYLPGGFSENSGSTWSEEDLFTAGTDLKQGKMASFFEGIKKSLDKFHLNGLAATAMFDTGEALFPGQFMVFKKGKHNNLIFNFDLLPMDSKEAESIEEIVDTFKRNSLAYFSGGTLSFPDIWNISFVGIKGPGHPDTKGKYNFMVLTDVTATYSGGQQTALVYDTEHPVNIQLQLTFTSIKHSYIFGRREQ